MFKNKTDRFYSDIRSIDRRAGDLIKSYKVEMTVM